MDVTKEINAKLGPIAQESAELALENLPIDQLARCESPIEKLLLCALWMRGSWTRRLDLTMAPHFDGLCMDARERHVAVIAPQVVIGPYRVDFLLAMFFSEDEPLGLVAVECDGHEFHEKTKQQAARDKARDRDLTMRGIQVFRYTGSEIWRDARACADEILLHIHCDWADKLHRQFEREVKQHGSVDAYLESLTTRGGK